MRYQIYLSMGFAITLWVAGGSHALAEESAASALKIGDTIADLKTHSLEGIQVSLRPPKGEILLIVVEDTGSEKADERAKADIVLYHRFHDHGLWALGVCTDNSENRVLRFSERWQIPWPQIMDKDEGDKKPTNLIGVTKTPFNILIDSAGKVLAMNLEGDEAHTTAAKILNASLDELPMPSPPEPRPEKQSQQLGSVVDISSLTSFLGDADERKDAEPCRKNLRKISIALTDYRRDNQGELPKLLSDLYPKYLQDESLLLCPKNPQPLEGYTDYADPNMKCSYLYEFSPAKRKWKTEQLSQWGDKVAMVRCLNHGRRLSLSYGGEIYFGQVSWENDFPQGKTLESDEAKVRKQLRELASALAKYKKDKGEVPLELEDLYPDYVQDKSMFICPVKGKPFSYQFSASKKTGDKVYRDWKMEQLKDFGDYVPIIRAKGVLENGNVIELGYGGEIYEGPAAWENLFRQ